MNMQKTFQNLRFVTIVMIVTVVFGSLYSGYTYSAERERLGSGSVLKGRDLRHVVGVAAFTENCSQRNEAFKILQDKIKKGAVHKLDIFWIVQSDCRLNSLPAGFNAEHFWDLIIGFKN